MKKRSSCLKNTHFGVKKIIFQKFTNILDFVAAIGFLEVVYIALLLIGIRNYFKGPLTTDIILNFEKCNLQCWFKHIPVLNEGNMNLLTLLLFCKTRQDKTNLLHSIHIHMAT